MIEFIIKEYFFFEMFNVHAGLHARAVCARTSASLAGGLAMARLHAALFVAAHAYRR